MSLQSLSFLSFLISPIFWSRLGFFISYIATSFIVLEVFRLIYSDSTKREAERLLDSYTKARTSSPRRYQQASQELKSICIDDLERPFRPESKRTNSTSTSPDSEKTLVEEKKRRSRAHSSAAQTTVNVPLSAPAQPSSTSPPRRLRKRSDTLTSTGSAEHRSESRSLFRRKRSSSPASSVGSKASSRHESPLRRSSRKEKDILGLGLGLSMGSGKARTKV